MIFKKYNIKLIDFRARSRAAPEKEMIFEADKLFKNISYPALIHCKSGADRAGIMCALYFLLQKKQETKTKHFYAPDTFLNKGGRVGLKFGSRKSNVQKIKETFNPKKSAAKKKKFPDLTGDGKVTFADILKGRGVKRG